METQRSQVKAKPVSFQKSILNRSSFMTIGSSKHKGQFLETLVKDYQENIWKKEIQLFEKRYWELSEPK
jgi:hypothetical protein